MPTGHTETTTIVVLAALQAGAEAAAIAAEPESGAGTFIPGQKLKRIGDPDIDPTTIHAYWTRWNMKPGQRAAFASVIGGPMNVIAPGGNVQLNRDRWMFDSTTGWSPDEVLAVLGLERWYPN